MPRDYPTRSYDAALPAPPTLLLDTISGAGAAYSVRRIKGDYTGPLLQVRRASDNATQDIGYTGGNTLDLTTLSNFIGSASAFITVWYDQSGNGRDMGQVADANQPLIATSGAINTQNGKPAVKANGTSQFMNHSSPFMYGSGAASIFTVIAGPTGQTNANHIGEANSTSNIQTYEYRPSATNADTPAQFFRNDANTIYVSPSITGTQVYLNSTLNQLSNIDSGSNISHFVNGSQSFTGAYTRSGVSSFNRMAMFASGRSTVQAFLNAHISEMIIYGTSLTTPDRQAVEASQKLYFGTP